MNQFEQYIAASRYAKYIPELGRREHWEETVERYVNALYKQVASLPGATEETKAEVYELLGATCER